MDFRGGDVDVRLNFSPLLLTVFLGGERDGERSFGTADLRGGDVEREYDLSRAAATALFLGGERDGERE